MEGGKKSISNILLGPLLGCSNGKAFLPKVGSKPARTIWCMLDRLVERDLGFYPSKEREVLGKIKTDKNLSWDG